MLIGIDCRFWNQTGVGRYTRSLVEKLSQIDSKNNYILFTRSIDDVKIEAPNFKVVTANVSWHSLEEQIELPRILNKYKLDLVHFPYFSVPLFYSKPYVVTIHDLIVNKYNTGKASTLPFFLYQVKRLGYKKILSNALIRSSKIIVPSQSVKSDILHSYSAIPKQKINVTYEGGFENLLNLKEKSTNYGKYFLRVGNFYPHKNVENLISAFNVFQEKNKGIKLVLVGKKDFFYKKIENLIKMLGIESKIIFVENPKDSELIPLYRNAVATIVPSFMEGFSLTAVEAMSVGSALIASDIAVHREICQDSALYFNPERASDLVLIMELLIKDNGSRKELIKNGKLQAKKYSWGKMARQTLEIYTSTKSS